MWYCKKNYKPLEFVNVFTMASAAPFIILSPTSIATPLHFSNRTMASAVALTETLRGRIIWNVSSLKSFIILVRFLVLVTTMVTKVNHGNHRSNNRGNHGSNHRGYYHGYYDDNTWFLHLSHRILPYLMTIGCEMNQILLRTLKNHLKRYILGRKNVLWS